MYANIVLRDPGNAGLDGTNFSQPSHGHFFAPGATGNEQEL